MRFIIVEDNKEIQDNIKKVIHQVTIDKEEVNIKIYSYPSLALTKDIITNDKPTVYLLDINLEASMSGIQIAKLIREKDWESQIIFITCHDKMFELVYRNVLCVFDFIEKFHNMEKRLCADLKKIINQKYDNSIYSYQGRNIDLHLFKRDILYIERDTNERKLIIHTKTNSYTVNKTITQMLSELDGRFRQSHRACIINIENIKEYDWTRGEFKLANSKKIPLLSKKFKRSILENAPCY